MRFAIAALCVLALTGSAVAETVPLPRGIPCDDLKAIPKQYLQPPTVKWDLFMVSRRELNQTWCPQPGRDVNACTYPDPRTGRWAVLVADDLGKEQFRCVIAYERAHMPPHFWGDPKRETPGAIKWLAEQRRATAH